MRSFISSILSLAIAGTAVAGTRVPVDAIQSRIATAIAARAPAPGHYRVSLSDQEFQLQLPGGPEGKWQIANLVFSQSEQAFRASLSFVNDLGNAEYVTISGAAYPVIEVPALSHDVLAGELVTSADLTTVEMPAARLSASVISSPDAVTGLVARRTLRAQAPLFSFDLSKQVIVKKGDLITILFEMPGIQLAAQGQVQGNAGKGDVVTVMNTSSRRMIEARITGAGQAVVSATSATITASSN